MRNVDAVCLAGFSEWLDLSGALIHGLSHAWTNRIASLSSYLDLMSYGEKEFGADVFLPREIDKLQALNQGMRLLVPRDEPPSAMELSPLVRDCLGLHAHHGRACAQQSQLVVTGEELPVRIAPRELTPVLLLLIEQSSASEREANETSVVFTLVCEELTVSLQCLGARRVSAYMNVVAAECGAQLTLTDAGVSLTLPTLLALRAR